MWEGVGEPRSRLATTEGERERHEEEDAVRNRNEGSRWTPGDGVECSVDPLDVLDQYRFLTRTYNGTLRSGDRSAAVAFHVAA